MYKLRNHTLTNLLLALCAFALGVTAQSLFGGISPAKTPVDGLLVYAVVAILYVVAILRTPHLHALPLTFEPLAVPLRVRRYTAASILAAGSVFAMVTCLFLFGQDIESATSWAFYLAAIVLFLAAIYVFCPGSALPGQHSEPHPGARSSRWEWIALGAILLIGLFFRLYRFTDLPSGCGTMKPTTGSR